MNKLMLLAAMLVMALATTVPAMAQVEPGTKDQETVESTDAGQGAGDPVVESKDPKQGTGDQLTSAGNAGQGTEDQTVGSGEPTGDQVAGSGNAEQGAGNQGKTGQETGNKETQAGAADQGAGNQATDIGNTVQGTTDKEDAAGQGVTQQTGSGEAEQPVEDRVAGSSNAGQKTGDQQAKSSDPKQETTEDQQTDGTEHDTGNKSDASGVEQSIDQRSKSGDNELSAEVSNSGNNVNQCVAILQAANSGGLQNAQGVAQDDSKAGDIEFGGSGFTVSPQLVQDCRQIILQIIEEHPNSPEAEALRSQAIETGILKPEVLGTRGKATNHPSGVAQPGVGQARIGQVKAAAAGLSKTAPVGRLPRTGGPNIALLLTLGAGVLLIGGGLLIRRIIRVVP